MGFSFKKNIGIQDAAQTDYLARGRHLDSLKRASDFIEQGVLQLMQTGAAELLAEDLRLAQQTLGEVTGEFTSDDLLGHIFSKFCVGK